MERVVRERMSIQDTDSITPQQLINIGIGFVTVHLLNVNDDYLNGQYHLYNQYHSIS
jgi:hypothetical protein